MVKIYEKLNVLILWQSLLFTEIVLKHFAEAKKIANITKFVFNSGQCYLQYNHDKRIFVSRICDKMV